MYVHTITIKAVPHPLGLQQHAKSYICSRWRGDHQNPQTAKLINQCERQPAYRDHIGPTRKIDQSGEHEQTLEGEDRVIPKQGVGGYHPKTVQIAFRTAQQILKIDLQPDRRQR